MKLNLAIKYRSLGNPYLSTLILDSIYSSKNGILVEDLKIKCGIRGYTFIDTFEGNILLLEQLKLIKRKGKRVIAGKIKISKSNVLREKILELFLISVNNDGEIFELFQPKSIFFDETTQLIGIKPNYLPLEYSQIRDFLLDYGFFKTIKDKYGYFINKKYNDYFRKLIDLSTMLEIKKIETRQCTLEELNRILDIRNEMGKQGEKIAIEFEKNRLIGHMLINDIKIISEFSVGKGYDIVSFNDLESTEINRFIEVKSYNYTPRFFWSQNEVETARQLGENYYIYLVNLSQTNKKNNILLIKNPYKNIFNSEKWKVATSTWEVNKI